VKEILNGDPVILLGSVLFGISMIIFMLNTRVRHGFVLRRYESRNVGWLFISTLLLIIGLGMIIIKAYLNGQLS
jgi:hypothetical protein